LVKTKITNARRAGPDHAVVTVTSKESRRRWRRAPCAECPWRTDIDAKQFPAEAFRISASTCYDMALTTFACHMSGKDKAATCAGFLLSESADHNLAVRLARSAGQMMPASVKPTSPTHATYKAMAVANDVDPDDPILKPCR
jgi:hypothetical protein